MFRMKLALAASALVCLALRAAEPARPLTSEQFSTLHALIKPAKDEDKWSQIPWQVNLWEARKEAAAQGKPILLWEMDGHPLGCT
jgi:hypothetical protein